MTFPYHCVRRGGELRYLPLIPVQLASGDATATTLALVDSGAEHNVFHADLARALGVARSNQRAVTLIGYDGNPADGFLVQVSFCVGRHEWQAPVIFSESVTRRGIVGQKGFFAFFTVTFRYAKREVVISRTR